MTATIKQLEACVEDEDCTNHNGDEMKLSVSDGKFNLRAIIKDNFPSEDKKFEYTKIRSQTGLAYGKGFSSGFWLAGNSQLKRTETNKLAFAPVRGLEFSERI